MLPASPTQAAGPAGPPPAPCQQVGPSLSLQRPATLLKLHVFTPAELLPAKYLNSSFSKHQEINIRHVQCCEDISPGARSALSPTLLVGTFSFLHGQAMAAALVHAWPWARAGGCHLSGKCHSQAKLLSVLYWPGSAALRGTGAEQSWELGPAPVLYFQEMNWDSSDLTPRVSVSLNSPLAKWVAVKLGNLLACPTPSVFFFFPSIAI